MNGAADFKEKLMRREAAPKILAGYYLNSSVNKTSVKGKRLK